MLAPLIIAVSVCTAATLPLQDPGTEPGVRAPAAWRLGTVELGAVVGYGRGTVIDAQRTSTSFTEGLVRLAFHFGATGDGAMRGNFAVVAEGVGMWVDQRPHAAGGGLNLLVRYTWAAGRWRPMALAGAGIVYSDEQIPPGETTRNFTPQAGLGLQYLVTDSLAVGGEYRFHHLSNKGRTETNPGINSHLLLFGISWFR